MESIASVATIGRYNWRIGMGPAILLANIILHQPSFATTF